MGTATETRIMIMLITIMSSSKVKPRDREADELPRRCGLYRMQFIYQSLYFEPSSPVPSDLE